MLYSTQLKLCAAALTLSLLGACGTGGDNATSVQGPGNGGKQTLPDKVPDLSTGEASAKKLRKASAADFSTYLKNGIYLAQGTTNPQDSSEQANVPDADAATPTYSTTNVQEQAVDESDRIKYDGTYLYVANNADFQAAQGEHKQSVRILKRDESGAISSSTSLITSTDFYAKQRLYLQESSLAVVLSNDRGGFFITPMSTAEIAVDATSMPFTGSQDFALTLVDIKDPSQTHITHQFRFDGQLVDTRVIGDSFYLISEFAASFDGFEQEGEDLNLFNYQKITETDIAELLPKVTDIKAGTERLLVDPATCYVPDEASSLHGYHHITSVTRLSLSDPDSLSTTCIASRTEGIYMSQNNVYLYGYYYDTEETSFDEATQTVIHQFNLAEKAVSYTVSGKVAGHLGRSNHNLRLSEHAGVLRVVTSRFTEANGMLHKLYLLEQQDDSLAVVAQLPNQTRTTPIGKVSDNGLVEEDIYAVRFFEEKAYIVTFRQIDPLYVVDLSDKRDPKIAGALEIPGYSAYLHPVSAQLLIGIGQNVQNWFLDGPLENEGDFGAKVSLFDVSDMSAPSLVDETVFSGGFSPVEFDYHAFSYIKHSDEVFRMTLPVESWLSENDSENSVSWYKRNELAAFEVHTGETPKLLYMGSSVAEQQPEADNSQYVWAGDDRGILHDDHIYYVHGNFVWSSLWQTPQDSTGPF
ncbi:beta-propeller domain-containing protein [Pseudoalteromonas sp. OOF1S-7]|uniref:beta-propeller domain-containing protein n=1 Tax=Pseudoalteromonas sp. OOF1S-7 TaxID=2917757 RepID=UPI001EF6F0F5|nr:beta-propeller domain-containing protein [Pseudoalteromonas sp. OOF1S-7]MCG7537236.1 beta-propeller domain-containing protein [Pseudoalteromonas sp. OOF1S-7]